ncbi:hypothetical protein [Microcoleus sp.]|uniref:hypothetical protein n=1 Tax=Microcoleus sp. TaxID=44472 RepID=UPI00403E962A
MKTKYIDGNPEVCLQSGRSLRFPTLAQRCRQRASITPHLAARDRARQLVKKDNPTLSPTINRTWIDSWGRVDVIAIYRIHPSSWAGARRRESAVGESRDIEV